VVSLGEKLKTIREAKGWDYAYVSRETNISSRYLEALENEDFSKFPGEPYVLGFLRNYGEYLGLDAEELQSLYRSLKLREQPVPVEQLLKKSSPLPKIFGVIIVVLVLLAGIGAVVYLFLRFPKRTEAAPVTARAPSEYVLNSDFLERRLYPGDSILVTEGANSYKLVFSGLSDTITVTTPKGPVKLDLGQEVTIDLNDDGFSELRIIAADFVKNDSTSGALLRFEQDLPPQIASGATPEIPLEISDPEREAALVVFSAPGAFPFTLQAVFQGYCLFRYEILFERDKPGRNEQYYQRSEEINISAQNGIRLGISNANAVKFQVIGGGRTVPLEAGGAGEVVAADLRWVRDEENRYRLVLLRLE
jgi:cytoskeletal protein RodZ